MPYILWILPVRLVRQCELAQGRMLPLCTWNDAPRGKHLRTANTLPILEWPGAVLLWKSAWRSQSKSVLFVAKSLSCAPASPALPTAARSAAKMMRKRPLRLRVPRPNPPTNCVLSARPTPSAAAPCAICSTAKTHKYSRRVILSAAKNPENSRCIDPDIPLWILPVRLACGSLRAGNSRRSPRMTESKSSVHARTPALHYGNAGGLQFSNPVGEPKSKRLRRRSQYPSSAPCP